MVVTASFIMGLKLGLEHVDLDDDDREVFGLGSTSLIVLDLGLFRINFFTGQVDDDDV